MPQADTVRLAVAGYSWGGISNVFAAARDSRVKALVNLDGSVRYWAEPIEQAKDVVPARVAVPMLFLAQRPLSLEELAKRAKPLVGFLNGMKYSDVYTVTLHPMEHFAFASEALRFIGTSNFNEYSAAEVSQAHGWMARYVLEFLNAYLLEQAPAKAFLANTPKQNGVPAHMATAVTQLSQGPAPTLEMLAAQASRTGFGDVEAVYAAMRERDPKFALPEHVLNGWGYKLLSGGDQKGAIEVIKMVTALHPESGNAYDSLAEAYEAGEDKAQAIHNYQRALKLNPKNENAVAHLKTLGAPN